MLDFRCEMGRFTAKPRVHGKLDVFPCRGRTFPLLGEMYAKAKKGDGAVGGGTRFTRDEGRDKEKT